MAAEADEVRYLLAEIERVRNQLWGCPSCGFAFDADHQDIDPVTCEGNGNYSCPMCELLEKNEVIWKAINIWETATLEDDFENIMHTVIDTLREAL